MYRYTIARHHPTWDAHDRDLPMLHTDVHVMILSTYVAVGCGRARVAVVMLPDGRVRRAWRDDIVRA